MKKPLVSVIVLLFCTSTFGANLQNSQTNAEFFTCSEDSHQDELSCSIQLVAQNNPSVRWVCTSCGMKQNRLKSSGRPNPGRCPRKKNGEGHTWVKD
ncbi:MAG: hypothetical protein K6B43_08695 [Treponema sp.]|nr:hypothetical protein [Treponema sp.]